jgi:hypothetical protein
MSRISRLILGTILSLSLGLPGSAAAAADSLAAPLEPFRPFLGKTWKGTFANSTPEKPMHDVARWERALNGQAIRILHSVNDGEYGGESLIVWDRKQERLVYYYFTTAGFYTQGTCRFEDGRMVSQETVTGNANGITAVRSTGELLPDGRLRSRAEYFKDGVWVPGHEIVFVEDPSAQVVFR